MTGIRLAEVPEEGLLTPPPVANNLSSVSSVRSDTIHTSQLKICIIRQHSNGVFGPDKKKLNCEALGVSPHQQQWSRGVVWWCESLRKVELSFLTTQTPFFALFFQDSISHCTCKMHNS